MLLFLPLLLLLMGASVVHNNVISNTLDEKLKKLHASGVYVEMLHEDHDIFTNTKKFIIRLDKVELIAELLFGIQNSEPIMVHLSKLQGLKLLIELEHTKFIFSNELAMFISMTSLPQHFNNQSLLFNEILAFSKNNPKMIHTLFNVWSNAFAFHIPAIKHTFAAENNISYNIDMEELSLFGYVKNHSDFDISNRCKKLSINLKEHNQTKATMNLHDNTFNVIHHDESTDSSFAINAMNFTFNMDTNSSIYINDFQAEQSFIHDETNEILSKLKLKKLSLKDSSEIFTLKDLHYDIAFNHLDVQTVGDIKELIDTSNTHTVAFIFNDLSDDIAALIQQGARINLEEFSFSDLYIRGKHYNDAKLSLKAVSQPKNRDLPIDLEMRLHLSKALYQAFLDQVPNASLTLNYVEDKNSSIDFHLKLSKEGLLLNSKNLFIQAVESVTEHNETNTTEAKNP
jgi:hypothetical protein